MTSELAALKGPVMEMGNKTIVAVDKSIQAMLARDVAVAGEVRGMEKEVDAMFRSFNELCLDRLSSRSLERHEVNFAVSSLRIGIELERICDYANQIAKLVQRKFSKHGFEGLETMNLATNAMKQQALDMLAIALRAYEEANVELPALVKARDSSVDRRNKELFRDMICILSVNPWWQEAVMDYHVAIRYVERVADRATNIAELAYYSVLGNELPAKSAGAVKP